MKTRKVTVITVLNAAILIGFLTPQLYFAVRAAFPMSMPEFNGLTYYQFIEWRKLAYQELEERLDVPEDKRGICNKTGITIDAPLRIAISEYYAMSGMIPALRSFINPDDLYMLPEPGSVTIINHAPVAWKIFEELIWDGQEYTPHTSLPQCRIPVNPATPEELETMRNAKRGAVQNKP